MSGGGDRHVHLGLYGAYVGYAAVYDPGDAELLEDGVSFELLEDGTSKHLLEPDGA